MKKLITVLIVVAVIAGGVYAFTRWQAQQQAAQSANYQTSQAERGALTASIGATGQVHSDQAAILTWKIAGTVDQVHVQEGDRVKAGDVLAELQQSSLPQNVILARADLVSAQKALADLYITAETAAVQALQAIASNAKLVKNAQYQMDNYIVPTEQASLSPIEALDLMEERLNQARTAFEPYKFQPSGDSKRQELKEALDLAQGDYNTAVRRLELDYQLQVVQANLEKARQDYDKWKNGPDPDDIAALEARIAAAQVTLDQVRIVAPFSGTITQVEPQPGDQVGIGAIAFRLDDLSTLLVDVGVSEVDINQIKLGQEASLDFDAIRDQKYKGVVVSVSRVGEVTQGVVDFLVQLRLTDADEAVKPGMTAAVSIIVNQLEDVLLVPNRAVRFLEGRQVVYILKDSALTPVNIKLGASSETVSEVIDGELKVGDAIVLNPPAVFDNNGPPPFVQR